jgi:hypothetical protein
MILEDAQLTQSKLNTFMYEARIKIHCKAEGCTGKNVSIHCKNDLVEYFTCVLPIVVILHRSNPPHIFEQCII